MTRNKSMLQEMIDNYRGCCEPWKIQLAATTIAEMGVPQRFWDDFMQELMIDFRDYRHDPMMEITERAALGMKIKSRVLDLLRREVALEKRIGKLDNLSLQETYTIDILQLCGENPRNTLCRAVRAAVAKLCGRQQQICRLFMQGYNRAKVAKIMTISWRELRKEMLSVRSKFVLMGLEEIISWRETNRLQKGGNF